MRGWSASAIDTALCEIPTAAATSLRVTLPGRLLPPTAEERRSGAVRSERSFRREASNATTLLPSFEDAVMMSIRSAQRAIGKRTLPGASQPGAVPRGTGEELVGGSTDEFQVAA